MTTPSPDAFNYTDDSVIARVAVDVPAQALTDISQLSSAMGAMRTQLEAIARAQGDWLDYLQQIPVIAERANQAYRDQITQLERISYIQNELGNSGGGGDANVSPQTPMRTSGSPGGTGYSTAAPAGYVNPFQGMVAGTGGGNRGAGAIADITGQLAAMSASDPRMMPNMASARGMAINPALLGLVGAAVAGYGGLGRGEDDPGGMSGTPTGKDRTAAGPSDPQQSGAPMRSPQQRQDTEPGTDAPGWRQQVAEVGRRAASEIGTGFNSTRAGQLFSMLGGAKAFGDLFGRKAAATDDGGQLAFDGMDLASLGGKAAGAAGMMGKLGKMGLLGKVGLGVGATGAAMTAFKMSQDIGERVTRLQMLGSEEGGDYATGLKEDMHARMIALDPMLSADEARKAIQLPMSAGFQGSSRDELRDLLINNFKELGVSMATSMSIEMANLRGQDLSDENVKKSRTSSEATMNVMKELAGDGGNTMALSERIEELKKLSAILNSLGSGQENIERSAIGWQEGYKDSLALRGSGSKIMGQTMASGTLLSMVGQKVGVTGYLPNAMPAALEEAGLDDDEITNMAAAEAAKYVSGMPKKLNRIAAFQSLMADQGVDLDWQQAKDLYERVSGEKENPTKKANKAIAAKSQRNQTNWNPISAIGGFLTGNSWSEKIDSLTAKHDPSQNADNVVDSFQRADRISDNQFAPAGQQGRQLPQSMAQAAARQTVTTQGQVTGEVRITVDQQGRVTAPPTIQLSGQQKAAYAGYGSAQLNNAPPGDPTYYHAYTALGGGQ